MAKKSRNVGGTTEAPTTENKSKRIDITADPEVTVTVNEDGKFTEVPTAWDSKKHNGPKKADFVSEDLYLDFLAFRNRSRAEHMLEQAEKFETRAKRIRQFGSEETRKKAMKLDRMREQMKELQAQLEADGIDLSDIESE